MNLKEQAEIYHKAAMELKSNGMPQEAFNKKDLAYLEMREAYKELEAENKGLKTKIELYETMVTASKNYSDKLESGIRRAVAKILDPIHNWTKQQIADILKDCTGITLRIRVVY